MNIPDSNENSRRILGRVARHEFVGRARELDRIVVQATAAPSGRGMLLLMEPATGVSELLRQAYDEIFRKRSEVTPIYFAFARSETTAVSAAIEFLNTFLQQFVAHRRNEPELCHSAMTLADLVELAPATDVEWIEQVVQTYTTLRFTQDDKALVRFCLSAPQRIPTRNGRAFVMLDGAQLADELNGAVPLGPEIFHVFDRSNVSFILAGLRRQVLKAAFDARFNLEKLDVLRLGEMNVNDARILVELLARRQQVAITEEARDLLVQQFHGSPFFIGAVLRTARERQVSLTSYLDCERVYVDELLGGQIERYCSELLEDMVPSAETRQALVRLLWEANAGERTTSVDAWAKRLHIEGNELEDLLHRLHVQEFVNWDGALVEATGGPQFWKDYLKVRYRLDLMNEPRALVVADALTDALKRAPRTMARHFRESMLPGLRDLLGRFDSQRVQRVFLDAFRFRQKYRGLEESEVTGGLAAETEFLTLPQVVTVASCVSFNRDLGQICDEGRCLVAHGFQEAKYIDANEVIWLAVDIESKLEVDAELAEIWCQRLANLATTLGFRRYQIWLISNEGFSENANQVIRQYSSFTSSRKQLELLAERIGAPIQSRLLEMVDADEFLIVLPMGEDNELIAASTGEQIARRLNFRPEAINQIKTAIVEACINAAEHSFSPDQKIYQRFRVESDRLVVTISSRGIVPANLNGNPGASLEIDEANQERRGWGLKLIQTLMDEVEFERADEGTSLRMTKYVRN